MIIVEIRGGLGNQMFQYAFGRAQAERLGVNLVLDTTAYSDYRLHHGFQLASVFNAPAREATPQELRAFLGWRLLAFRMGGRARNIALRIPGKYLVREPHFEYHAKAASAPAGSYFAGYWQSERYFAQVDSVIRREFTFRQPPSPANAQMCDRIRSVNAVSIHVRRGDFVADTRTNAYHGTCSADYYADAVRAIQQRVEGATFYVFSDDVPWVQANLHVAGPCVFVEHNTGPSAFEDMRLMSACRHHIIANSSFSWWGAWLGSNRDKLVIAPRRWFVAEINTDDLLPKTWMKL
ncbi:MAG TPA: alpha-1,2-fucosyltransferase [Candidatus Solibacter sp.]|nr:alpha-1,2-fucosyltransferase [Candidatus Solibacter sp.]